MKALNHRLTLEMTMLNSQATVHIKKNDTKNKLIISLSENGKPYTITENVHAVFVGRKPDGKIIFNDCDIVGNTITYTITAQTSVAVGLVACEIRLYDTNDNLLTSPNFTVIVDEIVYDADKIQTESENEINTLDSLISEAKALIAEVEATKNVFFAIYGTTTLEEIEAAVADGKTVFCKYEESSVILQLPLTRHLHKVRNAIFSGAGAYGDNYAFVYVASIGTSGVWSLKKYEIKDNDELFITEYDVTPFEDVADAIENGLAVFCKLTENDTTVLIPLTQYNGIVARFELLYGVAHQPTAWTLHNYSIFVSASGWEDDEKNSTLIVGDRGTGTPNAVQYIPQELTKEQQAQARANIGADASGTAASTVSEHNTSDKAHDDIRLLIEGLATRLSGIANSDDATLDQLSEIVTYIKSNKSLIDSITTSKVSVTDIINNLTSNVTNKPLSAAQGVALKALIDAISVPTKLSDLEGDATHRVVTDAEKTAWNAKSNFSGKYADLTDKPTIPTVPTNVSSFENDAGYIKETELNTAVENALEEAKESGEFDGSRGNGILNITTAPSSYTTATGGFTPTYRIALSTVKTQSKASEVLVGDTLAYSYYHYPVGYVDASYVYLGTRKNIRGATGSAGAAGADGADGYTPIKGTDYFTEADKAEMVSDLAAKLSLGIASDGLIYIFVDGVPVGTGIPQSTGESGDVFGYVDENNTIVLNGNLADGTYTLKYEMDNGEIVNIGNMVLDSNVYYSITKNLTQCSINNSATQIVEGESYSATITANDGYELKSVSVTMGGSAVSVSGGVINIASVTGNIVITAVAEEAVVAEPVTENITLTKDMAIVVGTGADRANTAGWCATPHIDVSNIPKPCVIHLAEAQWAYSDASKTGYARFYIADTSGTKIVSDYTSPSKMPSGVTMVLNNDAEDDVTVTITGDNIGTVRFTGMYTYGGVDNFADTVATLTYTPNS